MLCLGPLARLVIGALTSALGAKPIEVITRSTGFWTLTLLFITLSVTPLRKLIGWNWLLRLRRMLGLYAFFYALLHFITYIWLDQLFDPAAMLKDVIKRPFITVGFTSFLLLVPLAATSTDAMVRRLGANNWLALHRLAYATAIGGVAHFWWLAKWDISEPAIYAAALTLLLGMRLLFLARSRAAASRPAPVTRAA